MLNSGADTRYRFFFQLGKHGQTDDLQRYTLGNRQTVRPRQDTLPVRGLQVDRERIMHGSADAAFSQECPQVVAPSRQRAT